MDRFNAKFKWVLKTNNTCYHVNHFYTNIFQFGNYKFPAVIKMFVHIIDLKIHIWNDKNINFKVNISVTNNGEYIEYT